MDDLPHALCSAAADVAALGDCAAGFERMSDAELLAAQASITALRRCAEQYAALAAGAIAHRSRPEHGHAGLAQAAGFLSAEAMIQSAAGISRQDAIKLVRVGAMIGEAEAAAAAHTLATADAVPEDSETGAFAAPPDAAWSAPLIAAMSAGTLSIDGVEAIRRGLGDLDPGASSTALCAAVDRLIAESPGRTAEQLYRRARQARDDLDEAGIERREKQRRDLRSVRSWWDASGMHCGSWRLPPEEGMTLAAALDDVLSPRRGGPRFVDPLDKADAEQLLRDERTNEQIAADALVDMIQLAVDADPGTMFGKRRPAVRVMVTAEHLHSRNGHGRIEGHPDPISFSTVERHLCDTGAIAIGFDDHGQCVNVGRGQRLFTERQRTGMATRDGGCRYPGCDRPPSYTEAHHINQWHRDKGRTDIADGVLLCRRHHLLIHNNRWEISRDRGDYHLKPPVEIDPSQHLIPMPSHNPDLRALRRSTPQLA